MANRHIFNIPFVGLKQGVQEFRYDLGKEFFTEKGAEDFADAEIQVKLSLEKNSGFMLLKFDVGGGAGVTCDKCGNPLRLNLWDEFNMLVKLVDNPDEMNEQEEDPDVFYISRTESHLQVSDWLYEFALLSVPFQKMCSPDEMGGPNCNVEVLKKLEEMQRAVQNNANNIWKDLSKFREN